VLVSLDKVAVARIGTAFVRPSIHAFAASRRAREVTQSNKFHRSSQRDLKLMRVV
jgi:hypothetical protein